MSVHSFYASTAAARFDRLFSKLLDSPTLLFMSFHQTTTVILAVWFVLCSSGQEAATVKTEESLLRSHSGVSGLSANRGLAGSGTLNVYVLPMTYDFRVPLTIRGQKLYVNVDTAGPRLRVRPLLTDAPLTTCFGDECYVCAVFGPRCLGAETHSAWSDARNVVYGANFWYDNITLGSDGGAYLWYGVMHDEYNDKRGVKALPGSALGLGGGDSKDDNTVLYSLFLSTDFRAFSLTPAPHPWSSPGTLRLGGDPYKPPGYLEEHSLKVFLDQPKYNDFRKWHYKAQMKSILVEETPWKTVLQENAPVITFDSSAPIIYVKESTLKDIFIPYTDNWLKYYNAKHFDASLQEYKVLDAKKGYWFHCYIEPELPRWKFEVYTDEDKKYTEEIIIQPRDYVRKIRGTDQCRWLFGTSNNGIIDKADYMVMGQPFFQNHFVGFTFFNGINMNFARRVTSDDGKFAGLGSTTFAIDYDLTTVLSVDDQPIQVLVDTSVSSVMLLDANKFGDKACVGGQCHNCSQVGYRDNKCQYAEYYVHTTPDGLVRRLAQSQGSFQIGASRFDLGYDQVINATGRSYYRSAMGIGKPIRPVDFYNQLNGHDSAIQGTSYSIYAPKSPTSKLGILSLGGFQRPANINKVKKVRFMDTPGGWRDSASWPIVSGANAYLTFGDPASHPFLPSAHQIEIIAFLSGYNLIYGPEQAINALIEKLDNRRQLISSIKVDDAKQGWTIESQNVKKLPTVHFQVRTAPDSSDTEEIYLKPEDYTAYSDTQCNVSRILFGALDPKISGVGINTNYWIMGKPYFRTYYTEIYFGWKVAFARIPHHI